MQVCAELYRLVPAIEMLNVGVAAVSLAIDRQDGPAGGAWEFVMTVATLPVVVVRSFAVSWIITLAELAGYRPCRVLQAAGHFSTKLPWRMVERRLGVLVVAHPPRRARSKSCKVLERLAESHEKVEAGGESGARTLHV